MFYEPKNNDHGLPHGPFKSLVAPRPIGWISTVSKSGVANLAPYSFFNALADDPPVVMFSSSGRKDSLINAEETGEFVCNISSYELVQEMNLSSAALAADVDEFEHAGVEKAECQIVNVPRVAKAPAALECKTFKVIDLPGYDGKPNLYQAVLGVVVGIHIADEMIVDGLVDTKKLHQLARLGYMDYLSVEDVFTLKRPSA